MASNIKTESMHANLLEFVRSKEARLLKMLPIKAQEAFKRWNFLLLGEFFISHYYHRKTNPEIYEKAKPLKCFIHVVEKQKEEYPFEYEALDVYNQDLINEYYLYYLSCRSRRARKIMHAGEYLGHAFNEGMLDNPSKEILDYLATYKERYKNIKKAKLKAIYLCDSIFVAKCKKLSISRNEAIESLAKFITLFTERVSKDEASMYFNALDKQYLKELNY